MRESKNYNLKSEISRSDSRFQNSDSRFQIPRRHVNGR
jgi:hypothetical protein